MKKYYAHILTLVFTVTTIGLSAQTLWKVDANSTAVSPAGKVWNDAFSDFKQAIDSAVAGDTIFVSEGTYLPDRGMASRDSSFTMTDGVVWMGGFSFANNDTTLASRDFENYPTILSGEIQSDADSTNNSFLIIDNSSGNTINNTTVMDGFTITRAFNTSLLSGETNGGGMYNSAASPTISNCIFTLNIASSPNGTAGGAAMYNLSSSPIITNCSFTFNTADGDNTASDNAFGGAIRNEQGFSQPSFTNCAFTHNEAYGQTLSRGGAVYNGNSAKPTFLSCIFNNNYCEIFTPGSGNTANGAGVFNANGATSNMTNCLLTDNSIVAPNSANSIAYGAAICNFGHAAYTIRNTTISNNTATGALGRGGGIWNLSGVGLTVNNTIIYGNTASTSGNSISSLTNATSVQVSHSDFQGCGNSGSFAAACGTDNGGNIDADPDFTDDINLDYTLAPCSPAFDAGDDALVPGGVTTDLAGESRIQGTAVDIGAYETDPALSCGYTWDGSTDNDWNEPSNWDFNAVPPDFASIIIPNVTNQPILDTIRSIGSLTIETGADVTLNGNRLKIYGDIDNSGTINNNASVIELLGTTTTTIAGSFTIDTLINSGTGPVTISSGTITINEELRLEDGLFASGGNIILVSDASHTARIAEIKSGASISGSVTTQQFVDGSTSDWRMLSSPIMNKTIADWDDDFITSGFPGSQYPSFSFINMYTYDETVTGAYTNGYNAATGLSNSLGTGVGHMVYMGGSSFTIDLTGTVHSGPITVNLSFTSTPSASDDGWNLIGNPYPSAVDFGALTLASSVDDSYFVYDPSNGNYAVWNESLSIGTNGADGNIAQGQGFWVQATSSSPAPSVGFNEDDKVSSGFDFFYRQSEGYTTLSLYEGSKKYDEGILRKEQKGTLDFGRHDNLKLYNADTTHPAIAMMSSDLKELSINTVPGTIPGQTIIPIRLHGKTGVTYSVSFENSEIFTQGNCVVLEDLNANISMVVDDGINYSFQLPVDGVNDILRLIVTPSPKISAELNGEVFEVSNGINEVCEGDELTLIGEGITNSNFNWNNGVNNKQAFKPAIGEHTYSVTEINTELACQLSNEVSFMVNANPAPSVILDNDLLRTEEFAAYQWFKNDNLIVGATEQELNIEGTGNYHVVVTSDKGCEGKSEAINITGTGIGNFNEVKGYTIYPNPGKDNVTVEYGSGDAVNLRITNVVGKIVREEVLTRENKTVLNTSYLEAGVYFISIARGSEVEVIKWVKQ